MLQRCDENITKSEDESAAMEYSQSNTAEVNHQIGRYYRLEQTGNGVVFKPVKVPAHIIERRRQQEERHQIARAIEKNRAREARMSVRSILLYSLLLSAVAVVCFFYLYLQSEVASRMDHITTLKTQIGELTSENDIVQSRIDSEVNLFDVKKKATKKLGMEQASKDQIVYYSVENQDYILNYK